MISKKCNRCEVERLLTDFNRDSTKKGGFRTICKICMKKKYQENRDSEIRRVREYQKKNRQEVLRKKLIHAKEYFKKNHEKIKEYQKKYKSDRRKNDILFKLADGLRNRIYVFLKKKRISKKNSTFDLVGCTPEELKTYLEEKFYGGMTWDNREKWHIDHKIPLASAKTEEELYKLCHFTNLQPMWAIENIKKGSKII